MDNSEKEEMTIAMGYENQRERVGIIGHLVRHYEYDYHNPNEQKNRRQVRTGKSKRKVFRPSKKTSFLHSGGTPFTTKSSKAKRNMKLF